MRQIEDCLSNDIGGPKFIPYIQLHEFEALVFCGLNKLKEEYPNCHKEIDDLNRILESYGNNPETINNSPVTAPSKRIITALKGKYNYNKPQSGAFVTKAIGIEGLRSHCRHFSEWLDKLDSII